MLESISYVNADNNFGAVVGAAFWILLLAVHVALFLIVLRGILRAPLSQRSRKRWIWLVLLAPGLGVVLWLVKGRSAGQEGPYRA
ncbi:hypothetical protein [Sciscionella sediminilitoris]|uniref:hypothetical protein n=1 Tax=Sciscionella sediminilitoris TaxID=1445613 RepID=UPI00068CBDAC|nr:hypothetical protein [Sciscionella sp. SE31]